jgi:hypothetical protein
MSSCRRLVRDRYCSEDASPPHLEYPLESIRRHRACLPKAQLVRRSSWDQRWHGTRLSVMPSALLALRAYMHVSASWRQGVRREIAGCAFPIENAAHTCSEHRHVLRVCYLTFACDIFRIKFHGGTRRPVRQTHHQQVSLQMVERNRLSDAAKGILGRRLCLLV